MTIEPLIWMFFGVCFFSLGLLVGIVCYLPEGEPLYKYWDDAFDVEAENVAEIKYSERFPKPEWCE